MKREPEPLPEVGAWVARVRADDRGFFRGMPEASLALLWKSARAVDLDAGQALWEQGQDDGLFAWVWSGRLRAERDDEVIALVQTGDVLGLSSIHERPHTARVRASEPSRLVVWEARKVRGALESNPRALIAALGAVTELVGQLSSELVLLRTRARATQLVAWHVLRMARLGRTSVSLTRDELAARIGIPPRVLFDALGALARARIVRLEPIAGTEEESIYVEDPAGAQAVSEGRRSVEP
jgi:CRP-like cAMP-binding protein